MIGFFKPPRHRPQLPEERIEASYTRLRYQVYAGIFVGYAGYYLVRKNFSLAMPHLIEQGYSKTELGFALSGVAIAYGLSKFIMGSVSDRSNARNFMATGLVLSALVMIVMGLVPAATASVSVMFLLIGVHALDLVPKKAAGTAAGFTGLFGYVGGAVSANVVIGALVDRAGWDAGFALICAACVLAMLLLATTWNAEKRLAIKRC